MWKKAISVFLLGLALAGCGNNTKNALEDNRLTPEVKEEMTEESHPGIPGVGDLNENGTLDGYQNNDDERINSTNSNNDNNNEVNGTGNNEAVHPDRDDSIETPDMDGNIYEGGLDDNR